MLLTDLVATSEAVAGTSSRTAKIELVAAALARLAPEEVPAGVAYLAGDLRQRQIGVGWALLRDPPAPAVEPSLTVGEVDRTCERIGGLSGAGSINERRRLLADLLARATATEQRFLSRLLVGELRQGALEGVMLEAVARAAGVPAAALRRAVMLAGDLGAGRPRRSVERRRGGARGGSTCRSAARCSRCWRRRPPTSRPRSRELGPAAIEWKLDGARIQVHQAGDEVGVFTRSARRRHRRGPRGRRARARPCRRASSCSTARPSRCAPDGRPRRSRRPCAGSGRKLDVDALRDGCPLTPFFFDVLHVDGEDAARPPADRAARARSTAPSPSAGGCRAWSTADPEEAEAFLDDALAPWPRGRDGQGARRALRGRPARRRVAEGQAGAHPRPRGAGGRVGQRPAPGLAVATCTSAPATRDAAASSCWARPSRA